MKNLRLLLMVLVAHACAGNALPQEPPRSVLLVSLNAEQQVAVVDPRTLRVLKVLPSPSGPHEITVSRDGSLAYVADSGRGPGSPPGDSIVVLDLKTWSQKAIYKACPQVHDVRVSRDGSLLWAACAPMKAVLEMDAATGAIRKTWDIGLLGGWFVEVTSDDRKLYVPHLEAKALSVIDRAAGVVRTAISGTTQFGITVSPSGREVWVSDADENKLSIIDTSNDRVVAAINLGDPAKGQPAFSRLLFTPDGRQVVVVSRSKFIVVDVKRQSILWRTDMPHDGKVVTVSSDGRRAFVSHPQNDRISVINLSNRKLENTVNVGKQPDGIAWVDLDAK